GITLQSTGLAEQTSPAASHDELPIVTMMREWIIFALCLGVGRHIALGGGMVDGGDIALVVVMHAPGLWPWSTTGFYGLLSGVAVYGLVQAGRGVWKLFRHVPKFPSESGPNASW